MLPAEQLETLMQMIGRMNRADIARNIRLVNASFPIDFTPQFIETAELDRLRHIYFALCLQTSTLPADASLAA